MNFLYVIGNLLGLTVALLNLTLRVQIIKRANEVGENPLTLSRRFCDEFQVDMELLRCLPPNVEPRVSDHIPQIIKMISQVGLPCVDGVDWV